MKPTAYNKLSFNDLPDYNLGALNSGDETIYLRGIAEDFPHNVTFSNDINAAGFVRRGTVELKVNGKYLTVKPGEMFVILAYDFVEYIKSENDFEGRIIFVSTNRMLELVSEVEFYKYILQIKENPIIKLPADNWFTIKAYLSLIDLKLNSADISARILMSVDYLLHGLVIEIFEAISLVDEKIISTKNNVFKRFIGLLNTLDCHNHTVEWYASQLNVTPKHLSEICRKSSSRPASSWIKEYCMIDIKKSMRDESRSIKEISFMLGYSNLSFFGKCVRRWFGMSPTALREKLKMTT